MTVSVEVRHRRRTRADRDDADRGRKTAAGRPPRLRTARTVAPRSDRAASLDTPTSASSRVLGSTGMPRLALLPDSPASSRDGAESVVLAETVEPETRMVHHPISVVIPARNEASNVGWVLERMPAFVDEVVLVDGGSTDGTVDVARAIRPDIVVVNDNGKGKGDAMRVGGKTATGSIVVMIDADGSMDPAELDRFVDPLARGYEFVKGSRFMPGGGTTDMTQLRMLGNWGLNVTSNILFGSRWTDLCYDYCAVRRSALEDLDLDADGFEIETQMVERATRAGLRMIEVPSFEYPRRFGTSNLNTFRDGFRVLMTILRERVRPTPRLVSDEVADA